MISLMTDMFFRACDNLGDRLTGPMQFRLLLQPVFAAFFAIKAEYRDARIGEQIRLSAIFAGSAPFRGLIRRLWTSIGRLFIFAIVLDVIYQLYELHFVYPGEAFVVAIVLALLPYLIIRAFANALFRRFH